MPGHMRYEICPREIPTIRQSRLFQMTAPLLNITWPSWLRTPEASCVSAQMIFYALPAGWTLSRFYFLQHRQIVFYLKPADMGPECIPFPFFVFDEFIENMITKRFTDQLALLQFDNSLMQAAWK